MARRSRRKCVMLASAITTSTRSRSGKVPTRRSSPSAARGRSARKDSWRRTTATMTRTRDRALVTWETKAVFWLRKRMSASTVISRSSSSSALTVTGRSRPSSHLTRSLTMVPRASPTASLTARYARVTNATRATSLCHSKRPSMIAPVAMTAAPTVAGSLTPTLVFTVTRRSSTRCVAGWASSSTRTLRHSALAPTAAPRSKNCSSD